MKQSIGILIPTYQGARHLPHCLPPLLESSLKPAILVIDSSSKDGTADLAKKMGAQVAVIPQKEFNHGRTREKGRLLLGTDIVIMLTQDAYLTSSSALEKLIAPLVSKEASVAYARQLPHKCAGFFETFPREFNYPPVSNLRSLKDASEYGPYTFFCSNSCAAYTNRALDQIGGFKEVLFGEDTLAVAEMLHKGYRIAYVAEAEVHHSHNYTIKEEFARHFDMGLARKSCQTLLQAGGKDSKRGLAYVKALFKVLAKTHPSYLPYAVIQTAAKYCGYKLGQLSENAPRWFKKRLSSQKSYW
ncbi:MAG: glycosyltransferase [Parachlamydia sp.]|jgi:rhamnosyltransferase|nr:glycosyltransferase [Parachlamydia sp.]